MGENSKPSPKSQKVDISHWVFHLDCRRTPATRPVVASARRSLINLRRSASQFQVRSAAISTRLCLNMLGKTMENNFLNIAVDWDRLAASPFCRTSPTASTSSPPENAFGAGTLKGHSAAKPVMELKNLAEKANFHFQCRQIGMT